MAIRPQLPAEWNEASLTRRFRSAELRIAIKRQPGVSTAEVYVDGVLVEDGLLTDLKAGHTYKVLVKLPLK
ncbi:hypothetical protein D3C73_1492690 [compost metagenome]